MYSIRRKLARRFIKSKDGTAALEFGLVATPFFLLLIPIIEVAMVIFTSLVLENGVFEASRQIRTGQFQKEGGGGVEFKTLVCDNIDAMVDCQGDLHIDVKTFDDFGSATPTDPVQLSDPDDPDSGLTLKTDDFGFQPGNSSSVVIVRAY
ncbi:MAG: TadE/TadG family type IV pilus assembly protein [Hyphomicrobiales bacterium]